MSLWSSLVSGWRSSDQSLGTGLVIGLFIWTLTHLIDGVTGSGTVEYTVDYLNATRSNGDHAYQIAVGVTNLSREIPVPNLEVSIQNPHHDHQATFYKEDTVCGFEPPSWVGGALCDGENDGGDLMIPLLVPGNSLTITMNYSGSIDPEYRPIVRIRPGGDAESFRLVKRGLETTLTRYETPILLVTLLVAVILFCTTLWVPKSEQPSKERARTL